jgi:hypothetical protein
MDFATKAFRPVFKVSFYRSDLKCDYVVGFYDDVEKGKSEGEAWMKVHEGQALKIKAQ